MAMTKREFAARLLFWLLPWPISKALPRSLRIYYWGPTGGPPSGWYNFLGTWTWFGDGPPPPGAMANFPGPGAPPDTYIDPYNPPPPDQFPGFPDGPSNIDDPYTPGPGPDVSPPEPDPDPGIGWYDYVNYRYWLTPEGASWDPAKHSWDYPIGEFDLLRRSSWTAGWRPTHFRIEHDSTSLSFEFLDTANNDIVAVRDYVSMSPVEIEYAGNDIKGFAFDANADGYISRIEFLGPYIPND